jgi:hypothetical protein
VTYSASKYIRIYIHIRNSFLSTPHFTTDAYLSILVLYALFSNFPFPSLLYPSLHSIPFSSLFQLLKSKSNCFLFLLLLKVWRMRWAGHVARTGENRNAYRLLVGKPEGRRPLGRPRLTWVGKSRMDLLELEWGDVDWIGLAQHRDRWRALVNSVLNLRVS